jgi:hypothetical protein
VHEGFLRLLVYFPYTRTWVISVKGAIEHVKRSFTSHDPSQHIFRYRCSIRTEARACGGHTFRHVRRKPHTCPPWSTAAPFLFSPLPVVDTRFFFFFFPPTFRDSDAARHNGTCRKSMARRHVRARAVNVR